MADPMKDLIEQWRAVAEKELAKVGDMVSKYEYASAATADAFNQCASMLEAAFAELASPVRGTTVDNGNIYIFCDAPLWLGFDDYARCVRGAGHNGDHVFMRPPYPQRPLVVTHG